MNQMAIPYQTTPQQSIEWNGKTFSIEPYRLAHQADGAVLAKYGNTTVLCTVVVESDAVERDFLPLMVSYMEKSFAAGRIPGGYFRREGKPTEIEVLTSRLIDRTLRPMLPSGFRDEVQIICTLLSHDKQCDPAIVALVGASAALALSGAPISDIVAACKVGYIDGQLVANPTLDVMSSSDLDLIVSCSASAVVMIESEAREIAEDKMVEAIQFAHHNCQPMLKMLEELVSQYGREKIEYKHHADTELHSNVAKFLKDKLVQCYTIANKRKRLQAIKSLHTEIEAKFLNDVNTLSVLKGAIYHASRSVIREHTLNNKLRIDGRGYSDIRPVSAMIDVLPKEYVHGSATFRRGDTEAMVVTTLGGSTEAQSIETLKDGSTKNPFMLHYNFLPYSVGEAEPLRGTSRREIGHGQLAAKAIRPLLPKEDTFPYTIRVVSEITSCYGSSSMATVCAASMSLMATSVPITNAVSGVAMGLIKTGDKYAILTDITGDEDHFGDMDFKVAGTSNGLTALQLDIKISGLSHDIIRDTLNQSRDARHHILEAMNAVISGPAERNEHAPQIITLNVAVSKIASIIGKGGAVIKSICEKSGCQVSVENDGLIKICAVSTECGEKAMNMIKEITTDIMDNSIHHGPIERIIDCGAIVSLPGGRSGMVHISQISDARVEDINDVLSVGQTIKVIVLDASDQNRIRLSMKRAQDGNDGDNAPAKRTRYDDGEHGDAGRSRSGWKPSFNGRGGDRGGRGDRDDRGGGGRRDGARGGSSFGSRPPRERSDDAPSHAEHGNFFAALGTTKFDSSGGNRPRRPRPPFRSDN